MHTVRTLDQHRGPKTILAWLHLGIVAVAALGVAACLPKRCGRNLGRP